jgi:phosphoenolpyruvate-protein kinase (PTS system EI component)
MRFLFENPGLLRTQVRAVQQAAADGPARLLLPMVNGPDDVRRVREVVAECHEELRREGIRHEPDLAIGSMIESPAGLLLAREILAESDFLSAGTNDLTMYLLAADRDAQHLAAYYDPFHPAVIRSLRSLADLARAERKPFSVCGEISGDPTFTGCLVGLGVERLSMSPQWVLPVGNVLASLDAGRWRQLGDELITLGSAEEVRRRVREAQVS